MTAYKLWHEYVQHFPKQSRYTLGAKIDDLFLETIELVYIVSYLQKDQKLAPIQKAIGKLDLVKFMLQVAFEIRAMDTKKYVALSELLNELGRMLGGWLRQILKQTSAQK